MRTIRKRVTRVFVAIILSGMMVFAFTAGRILVEDSPQPSDVIVVLAGETDRRPAHALELLNQGYAPHLIIDVPVAERLYDVTEMEIARRYFSALPQSASIEICPIEGLSTREETKDVQKCLAREPSSRVLIVTSDFHTRRALSIFRRELHGKTFSVGAAHDPTQFGTLWWTHRQWAKTCLSEWLRMIWWNAVERWK